MKGTSRELQGMSPGRAAGTALAAIFLGGAVWARSPVVNLPRPDAAGWIRLFRGNNTADFYTFMGNGRQVPSKNKGSFPNAVFTVVSGDTIQSAGSPLGHLIFRQPFSHYRLQFQMRWPGGIGNTGILNKVQEDDTAQSQGFPRSVECQGDPNQGMGQIWSLGSIRENGNMVNGGTWITVRAKSISHPFGGGTARQFDPSAPEIDYGGVGDPSNNLIVGRPGWRQPRPAALGNGGWINMEVESHGHDTTRHFVDEELVMEYRNPRIAPRNNANQVQKLLTAGVFAWQSEGSRVWFRNIRIRLFPQDSLYGRLYPTALGDPNLFPRTVANPLGERLLAVLAGGQPGEGWRDAAAGLGFRVMTTGQFRAEIRNARGNLLESFDGMGPADVASRAVGAGTFAVTVTAAGARETVLMRAGHR